MSAAIVSIEEILSGADAPRIAHALLGIVKEHLQAAPENAAKTLYLELDEIEAQHDHDAETLLTEKTRALSHTDKALFAKYLIIRNTCRSAASIIAVANASEAENPYKIDHMIGLMKRKGMTAERISRILETITQWKTGTPHPTQHLSERGKTAFRDLLGISNLPADTRETHATAVIKCMLDITMTRNSRMDVREETLTDRAQARLHRQAQRLTYRTLQASLEKHYPDDTPNLLSGTIRMTLPYHTWYGAGDADGKSNADKKALLEGMIGYTADAIEEHLSDINHAIQLDPSLAVRLKHAQTAMQTVFDRLKTLESKLYDSEDSTGFDALKHEFSTLYERLSLDQADAENTGIHSEKELYKHLTIDLRDAINHDANDAAAQVLSETLFNMRQYKETFTTAKIETRANGPVDIEIMNRLFGDIAFQNAFLNGPMKRALMNRSFTSLTSDEQRYMMRWIGQQARKTPEAVQALYFRIFPEGPDDKGFPNQLRERGERLALQAITPDKFGMSIVAEASEMSAEYAFFLGEQIFGVGRMMHTMLNEDMETLEKAPDFLIDFAEHGGHASLRNAIANSPRLADLLQRHGAMLPCSDSVKKLGPAAFYLQAQAINLMMNFAVDKHKTICIKWGNGQALTRGGGNAHIPGRLKAQAVQWHLNGRVLDPDNPDDIKILANVMFASNTEQGRAADFMSPNAERIAKNQLKMIGEMLARALELMGKVEKGTYINQVAQFSKGSRRVFGGISKDVMMRGYENMRNAVDSSGQRLSDSIARKISNMKLAGDANQAARPDSKIAEDAPPSSETVKQKQTDTKPLHDLRAIGTTIAISHMRSYHDGWFNLGRGLQAVHEAYINNEIGEGDLRVFLEDPLWSNMIKNGLRTATMSDMPHVFEALDAGDWPHEKAMQTGKSVIIHPTDDPRHKPPCISFDRSGGATFEQAYVAKLYYDQALLISYTEKLAEINLTDTSFPESLQEVEQYALTLLQSRGGRIGRFQTGPFTNRLFPLVSQDRNGNRQYALASQILCDISEEDHETLTQAQRNAITGAQRSTQVWNNADLYLDLDAYGSKPLPDLLTRRLKILETETPG